MDGKYILHSHCNLAQLSELICALFNLMCMSMATYLCFKSGHIWTIYACRLNHFQIHISLRKNSNFYIIIYVLCFQHSFYSTFVLYIVNSLLIIDFSLVEKTSKMSLTHKITNVPNSQNTIKTQFLLKSFIDYALAISFK